MKKKKWVFLVNILIKEILRDRISIERNFEGTVFVEVSDTKAKFSIYLDNVFRGF